MAQRPTLLVEELAGLELYLDVLRLGSISAAARDHGITQPSATERLRTLERRMGVTLLRRGPSGSAPTPQGEAFAAWARTVLGSVEQLAIGVAALRSAGAHDPLRLMASLTVADYVLPGWLHAYRSAGGRPVELRVGNSVAVAAAVAGGQVELGFVESPRRFPGLRSVAVDGDELAVVVAPGHPWARRRTPLDPAVLAATPLLAREPGSGTREAFEAALAAVGLVAAEPMAVLASTTALKAAAAAGEAPCVLSRLAVGAELAAGVLVAVPVAGLDLGREFRAVWRPGGDGPEIRRFLRRARRGG